MADTVNAMAALTQHLRRRHFLYRKFSGYYIVDQSPVDLGMDAREAVCRMLFGHRQPTRLLLGNGASLYRWLKTSPAKRLQPWTCEDDGMAGFNVYTRGGSGTVELRKINPA